MPVTVKFKRPRAYGPPPRPLWFRIVRRLSRWIGRLAWLLGRLARKLYDLTDDGRVYSFADQAWIGWDEIKAAPSPPGFDRSSVLPPDPFGRTLTIAEYLQGRSDEDQALLDEGRRIWKEL